MIKKNDGQTGPQGTQVFEVSEINRMIAKEIVEAQSDRASVPALIGISNDVVGQQYILTNSKIEVGRRPGGDIVLKNASVSSMHAQIIGDNGQWKVLNLLSSNGTFINGEKVAEQQINPGDIIGFAGSEFVYSLVESEKPGKQSSSKSGFIITGVILAIAFSAILVYLL